MHFQGERKKFHTSPPLFSCPRAPRSTAAQSRPRPRAPPRSPQPLPLLTRMGNKNYAVLSIMPCQCILQKSSVATCCTRHKSPLNYCHPGPGNENPPLQPQLPPLCIFFIDSQYHHPSKGSKPRQAPKLPSLMGCFRCTDSRRPKGHKTGPKSSAVQPTKEVQGHLPFQAPFYPI